MTLPSTSSWSAAPTPKQPRAFSSVVEALPGLKPSDFCFSPCRLHPRGQAAHVWPRAQARTRSTAAKITRAAIRSRSALDGILPTRPGLHPGGQEAPLSYRISADIRQIPATADLLMKQDGHRTAARCVSCPSQERYRSSRDRRDRRRFASCSRGTHWSKEKDTASSAAWRG